MSKPDDKKPAPAAAAPTPPAPAVKAPAAKVEDPAPHVVKPILLARWSEAQFVQNRHAVRPEAATPYKDVLDPAYFAHIAPKLNANDIIEVRPAEGSYYAELYVWSKGSNWAQVSELKRIERPAAGGLPSANKAFSIEFVEGPAAHRVIRNSDRGTVAQGFVSPEAANAWLEANAKQIAA